jgi:hypothetical protein
MAAPAASFRRSTGAPQSRKTHIAPVSGALAPSQGTVVGRDLGEPTGFAMRQSDGSNAPPRLPADSVRFNEPGRTAGLKLAWNNGTQVGRNLHGGARAVIAPR